MQNREILDIIDLIYFAPALGLTIWICVKHGFGRQLGWFYLIILSLLRLIAGSTGIVNAHSPSRSATQATTVTYSVGLAPLILALMGILKRLNEGMTQHQFPPLLLQALALPTIAGLIVGIYGGLGVYSPIPSKQANGIPFVKASSILFLVVFLALVFITALTILHQRSVRDGEKRLLTACAITIPFYAVRIVYQLLSTFDRNPKYFSLVSTADDAVIVQGCMSLLMEFIIVGTMLWAGLTVKRIPRDAVRPRQGSKTSAIQMFRKGDKA